ncbi:A/G-specific adenine glycosylase [Beijerinckia indica]|uniref:Adenine DNA glycosylase n=1 Tax=Beijerinckia indica subsp. indica (strain ATCC 9039 / DSM 1715 / NCIMB 8712) TaxID=395963 RepID=B2IGY4_BEII9|nr:A/G-specific adenine glycosylase [Beijerinckia indica]ACB94398.1 A/G-specific adenine glycosylase [Beijerinckia indica subsp. indica ATCC 9039]
MEPPLTGYSLSEPSVSRALLAWYDAHRRDLPWRAKPGEQADPYAVWLSEIMLQQTTVTAVKPYYATFLGQWPRLEDLAAAPLDAVLRQWAGLGYYSRARNLHACAIMVMQRHGGVFPAEESLLRALPGIGAYTAAAIAAIAHGRRAVVVDGNVERVISRLFAIESPLPEAKAVIRAETDRLTPNERAGDFAQAMMDLGSMICTPRQPQCLLCPLAAFCVAKAEGRAGEFPIKAPKREKPIRHGVAFFLRRGDGAVLLTRRPARGLLGGMMEIPGGAWNETPDLEPLRLAPVAADWQRLEGEVTHVFTHFALRLSVYAAKAPSTLKVPDGCRFVAEEDLDAEALPSLMRKAVAAGRAFFADKQERAGERKKRWPNGEARNSRSN